MLLCMFPPFTQIKRNWCYYFVVTLSHLLAFASLLQEAGPHWATSPDGVWLSDSYGLCRPCKSAARGSQLGPQLLDPLLQWWVLTHSGHHPHSSLSAVDPWVLVGAQCLPLKKVSVCTWKCVFFSKDFPLGKVVEVVLVVVELHLSPEQQLVVQH